MATITYEITGSYPPFAAELVLDGITVDYQVHDEEGIYSFTNVVGSGVFSVVTYDTASGVETATKNITTTTTTTTTVAPITPYNPTISIVLNSSSDVTGSAWKLYDVVFTPPVPVGSTVTVDFEGLLKVTEISIPAGVADATAYIEIIKNGSTYYEVLDSPITPPNTVHTTGPFSTAVNAVGGSPQISNGDTLSFRLDVTAVMGASTGGEATGEVVYLTVPSASVSPLGTPTIIPSLATQEINQHVITTALATTTTTTTTTTVAPTFAQMIFTGVSPVTDSEVNSEEVLNFTVEIVSTNFTPVKYKVIVDSPDLPTKVGVDSVAPSGIGTDPEPIFDGENIVNSQLTSGFQAVSAGFLNIHTAPPGALHIQLWVDQADDNNYVLQQQLSYVVFPL